MANSNNSQGGGNSQGGNSSQGGSNNQGGSGSQGNSGSQGSKRGFAAMGKEEVREIASDGGKAAHESGNAHEFSSEEASKAGKKARQSRGNSGSNS
jgi:hypothetical protein